MKIYQDIFNNEELISDSFKFEERHDGVVIAVPSRMVVKGEDKVDVGCGNAFGGKNEDEEEGGPGEVPPEKVDIIVDTFNYQETGFDKENFKQYFKEYMNKVVDHLKKNKPDRVDAFKAGAIEYFKWVLSKFDEFSFYTPSNYDAENQIILSYYVHEADEAPTYLYIMDGLKFYKV